MLEALTMSAEIPETNVAAGSTLQSSDVDEHLRFGRLISDLSVRIVSATAETLDETIEVALGQLGSHLRLGLATVVCFDPSRDVFTHTHEWYDEELFEGSSFLGTDVGEPYLWVTQSLAEGRDVLVSTLEDLPPEAKAERKTCKALGIRSVLWVPFWTGEQVSGYVAFNSIGRETRWTEQTIQRLRLAGEIIGAALDRRRQASELEERLEFEHFVSQLSARLVESGPEELDATVRHALQQLARILGLERATLGQVRGEFVVVTHWWVDESLPASQQVLEKELPIESFWILRRALAGQTVAISSRDELPEGAQLEQRVWDERGLKSTIFVPGRIGNKILGAVAMDSLSRARRWSEDTVRKLALPVELLFTALARSEAEAARRRDQTELKTAYEEISQLKSRLEDENVYLRNEIRQRTGQRRIIGDSDAVKRMLEAAGQVAATDSTVLISGETGTGKELLARAIHTMSDRRDRTLVRINCGSLPPTLIESELFGREKGAYTGALTQQKGRFEIAHGSTILLDEIGELPLELQPKLLEVLETGRFERLGSTKTVKVDVRVIAASNRDLEKAVEEGRFREDLFFRLNVFPIEIPPLRERPEDIPLLVWSFVREFSKTMGKSIESIPREQVAGLQRYGWPGNVRELRNVIERAMIRSAGPVLEIDLPEKTSRSGAASLEEIERDHVREILEATGWRVRGSGGAAEILGLKPTTLDYRMKKLGIRRPSKTSSIS
jgi:transcriptional regulator with GAF, ATPase, and Fis domain